MRPAEATSVWSRATQKSVHARRNSWAFIVPGLHQGSGGISASGTHEAYRRRRQRPKGWATGVVLNGGAGAGLVTQEFQLKECARADSGGEDRVA